MLKLTTVRTLLTWRFWSAQSWASLLQNSTVGNWFNIRNASSSMLTHWLFKIVTSCLTGKSFPPLLTLVGQIASTPESSFLCLLMKHSLPLWNTLPRRDRLTEVIKDCSTLFFSDWATKDIHKHLPFLYNMVATATYTYLPAFKKFGENVKIVHFIGVSKPWHAAFDQSGQPVPRQSTDKHAVEHLKNWWQIYHSDVVPQMRNITHHPLNIPPPPPPSASSTGSTIGDGDASGDSSVAAFGAAAAAAFNAAAAAAREQSHVMQALQSELSKQAWEQGQPDFRGSASMDNILKKIDDTMASPNTEPRK